MNNIQGNKLIDGLNNEIESQLSSKKTVQTEALHNMIFQPGVFKNATPEQTHRLLDNVTKCVNLTKPDSEKFAQLGQDQQEIIKKVLLFSTNSLYNSNKKDYAKTFDSINKLTDGSEHFRALVLSEFLAKNPKAISKLRDPKADLLKIPNLSDLHLEELHLTDLNYTDEELLELFSELPYLKHLSITGNNKMTGSSLAVLNNSKLLESLEISDCSNVSSPVPQNMPYLEKLTLNNLPNYNHRLPPNLQELKYLKIIKLSRFNRDLPKFMPNLLELKIEESSKFNKPIPEGLTKLKYLYMDANDAYDQPFPNDMSELEVLIITKSGAYSKSFPPKFENLKMLGIGDNKEYNQDLPYEMPNLQQLNIEKCSKFNQALPKNLLNIKKVCIEGCDSWDLLNHPIPDWFLKVEDLQRDLDLPENERGSLKINECKKLNIFQLEPEEFFNVINENNEQLLMYLFNECPNKTINVFKEKLNDQLLESDSELILDSSISWSCIYIFPPDILQPFFIRAEKEDQEEWMNEDMPQVWQDLPSPGTMEEVFLELSGEVREDVKNNGEELREAYVDDVKTVFKSIPLKTVGSLAEKYPEEMLELFFALTNSQLAVVIPLIETKVYINYLKTLDISKHLSFLNLATYKQKNYYLEEELFKIPLIEEWNQIQLKAEDWRKDPTEEKLKKIKGLLLSLEVNLKMKKLFSDMIDKFKIEMKRFLKDVSTDHMDIYFEAISEKLDEIKLDTLKKEIEKASKISGSSKNEEEVEPPEEFVDLVTQSLMDNPYRDPNPSGKYVFDLETWKEMNFLNPITRIQYTENQLILDSELKKRIDEFKNGKTPKNDKTSKKED